MRFFFLPFAGRPPPVLRLPPAPPNNGGLLMEPKQTDVRRARPSAENIHSGDGDGDGCRSAASGRRRECDDRATMPTERRLALAVLCANSFLLRFCRVESRSERAFFSSAAQTMAKLLYKLNRAEKERRTGAERFARARRSRPPSDARAPRRQCEKTTRER